MSNLSFMEQLLDGVGLEWKALGEMAKYEQPTKYLVQSTNYSDDFETPVLTAGKTFILGYTDETDGINKASKTPVIIFDDFTTANKWVDFDFKAKSSAMKMISSADRSKALSKYIYYWLNTLPSELVDGDHKRQWISNYANKKIPIPCPEQPKKSLEIQTEIVRILDTFTELTAELTTELTARKKQYSYYRDQLILNSSAKSEKLENISEIFLGLTYTPTYVTKGVKFISAKNISGDYLDLTNVKYISEDEYQKSTSNAKPKRGDVLFTRVGSNLGHPVIVDTDEKLCMFVSLGFIRVNPEKVLNSYIKHWMNTDLFWGQVRKKAFGAAKVNLNTGWLKAFDVMLPTISEQERIVGILDKFDTLTKSNTEGLPQEIELRRQQYQHYRDFLLSFPKPDSVVTA